MKENAKTKKPDEMINLDGDFNDKFKQMLKEVRKEKAEKAKRDGRQKK